MAESSLEPATYPSAPWPLTGQLWVSLFRVPHDVDATRKAGVYGAAFVSYEPDSPLTYSELLVARPLRTPRGRRVSITDIWVDSPASMAGGRELWAIPKDLCDFTCRSERHGPLTRTTWTTTLAGRPVASARFTDGSRFAPRLPFKGATWQQRDDGEEVTAWLTGSSRALPCRATWSFDPDGPLGWLHGKRSLASFRQADFAMSFG
jgi:acetoacetate decarboxylase